MAYKKSRNQPHKNKIMLVLLVCLAVFLVTGSGYFVYDRFYSENDVSEPNVVDGINYDPPSEEELQQNDVSKINDIENTNTSSPISSEDNPVKIQEAYYDTGSSQLVVKTELYGTNWSKCKVLIEGTSTITREANAIYGQPYSSCEGFAVSDPGLSSGNWSVTLEAIDNQNNSTFSDPTGITID